MSPNETALGIRRRQSPVAVLFIALKFLRSAARMVWPLLLIWLFNPSKSSENTYVWLLIAIGGFQLTTSVVAWFRYFFYVKDDELLIEKGVFQLQKLNIPFDRIQTINFEQNILHRILNVVRVQIDTAGSSGNELSLHALDLQTAETLRDLVLIHKKKKEEHAELEAAELSGEAIFEPKLIFKRQPSDLISIGITQNHLQTALIVLGAIFGFIQLWDEVMDVAFEEWRDMIIGQIQAGLQLFWTIAIPVFIILTVFVSLVRTFIRYYNLSLWETEEGYKVIAGLFNRQEQAIRRRKIQFIKWSINPLQALLKFSTIRLYQASSKETSNKRALSLPGSSQANVSQLLSQNFTQEALQDLVEGKVSPLIIGRRFLYTGLVPTLLGILLSVSWMGWNVLFLLLWLPINYFLAYRFQSNYRFYLNDEVLKTRSWVLNKSYLVMHLYKVQRVDVIQSIYQRRKGVANVRLFTAAGSVEIPYLAVETAHEIRDYVLYKAESDGRPWM